MAPSIAKILVEARKLAGYAHELENYIISAYDAKDDHSMASIVLDAHCFIEERKREEERTG